MAVVSNIVIGVLALSLAGCEMRSVRAKTPPTPAPAATKKEPPPAPMSSEPLSTPQTQVHLPKPQPIDQEALAPPPPNVPADPATQRPPHKAGRRAATVDKPAAVKPEPPVETAEAPPAEMRPRIEPVLPADQRQKLMEDIASRLRDVDQKLARISLLKLSDPEKESAERVRSFSKLAHEAFERGDTQQASALTERALLLEQELLRVR